MPPCDSSVRYFLVKIEPPGQQTFSYSPKLNLSTALTRGRGDLSLEDCGPKCGRPNPALP